MDNSTGLVLPLVAEKLGTTRPGNNPFSNVKCRVDRGLISLTYDDNEVVLYFPESSLKDLLDGASEYGAALWGTRVSAAEAAARLIIVHLDESLATREPHPSGTWTYTTAGFTPLPPWELHRR